MACSFGLGGIKKDEIIEWGKNNRMFWSVLFLVVFFTAIWICDSDLMFNKLALGFSVLFLLGIMQIRWNIQWNFIEFVSRNAFCIYIIHWPLLMVIRLIVYQKLHIPAVPSMLIMLVGGITIAAAIALGLRQFKSPFMKSVNKVVFGM